MKHVVELDGVPATADDLQSLALINYGHFTSMQVVEGSVRGLDLHLERLAQDSRRLFSTDLDLERVRALARRVAGQVHEPTIMRVTVYDPDLALGHPAGEARPRILITLRASGAGSLPPMRLRTVAYQRELPEVKHVGLLGTVYQRRMAQRAGFDDVLFVGADGLVTEGATWNIGFVVDGKVRWPAGECLSGVTMRLLTAAMERAGISVDCAPVYLHEISGVSAAFITNAGVGVRGVASIDDLDLSDGAGFVERLRKEYESIDGQAL